MRFTRLIVAAVTLALLGLLPAMASSSGAASGTDATVSQKAAPATTVTARGVERRIKGKTVPFLVGTVNPKKGPVYIQKATACRTKSLSSCNFTFLRKEFLKDGKYSSRIGYAPTRSSWVFRAKVRGVVSSATLTCTKPPSQDRCRLP